jgi:hypothetical protein
MSWTVYVEPVAGGFEASLVGDAAIRASGGTADEAVAGVKAVLDARRARGYFVTLDDTPTVRPELVPRDDAERQAWDEVVAEIYRERDAQKKAEFPE